jgi:hypothetical protein
VRWLVAILVGALVLGGSPAVRAAEGAKPPEPRESMHKIFEALTYLLPASLDEQRFAEPERREEVLRWMDLLVASADEFEQHGERRDVDFRNLSRSLVADVSELRQRYWLGRADEARYFLIELTRYCVACHSRLPKARDFPLGERLVEQIDMDGLSVHEQAQILVATRQFDRALAAWESLFEDPAVPPAQMDLGGYILDYLTVNVRVQRDAKRPQAVLRKIAKRTDTPRYLKRHLADWVRGLEELTDDLAGVPDLSRARALMRRADDLSEFPADRERLVYDLVASALLLRYIDLAPKDDPRLAEAFYWLGVAESRSIDAYWVPQTEFHFEASIRLDPSGPFAEDAYALLEEYVTVGYGGVFGEEELPLDVWAQLQDLRNMIDGASTEAAPKTPSPVSQ